MTLYGVSSRHNPALIVLISSYVVYVQEKQDMAH